MQASHTLCKTQEWGEKHIIGSGSCRLQAADCKLQAGSFHEVIRHSADITSGKHDRSKRGAGVRGMHDKLSAQSSYQCTPVETCGVDDKVVPQRPMTIVNFKCLQLP